MDSSNVILRICGWPIEYLGFSNVVEDHLGYGSGDGFELGQGEVVEKNWSST
jgi:hypothetical protein